MIHFGILISRIHVCHLFIFRYDPELNDAHTKVWTRFDYHYMLCSKHHIEIQINFPDSRSSITYIQVGL